MNDKTKELLKANTDVLKLIQLVHQIGWTTIREQSIQRMLYISKVLYLFVYKNDDYLKHYHFSTSISGPFSDLITRSIIDLKARELITEDTIGNISLVDQNFQSEYDIQHLKWLKTIVHIFGLYGENNIYSFTIHDPLYKEAIESNSQKELETSLENKTIKVLNQFREAFEETITKASQINEEEYIELYFEYIFSKIIKREE